MGLYVGLLIFFISPLINAMERNNLMLPEGSKNESHIKCVVRARSFEEAEEKHQLLQSLTTGDLPSVRKLCTKLNNQALTPETQRKSVFAAVAAKDPEIVNAALEILQQRGISLASLQAEESQQLLEETFQEYLNTKQPQNSPEHRLFVTLMANYQSNTEALSSKNKEAYQNAGELFSQPLSSFGNQEAFPLFNDFQINDCSDDERMDI